MAEALNPVGVNTTFASGTTSAQSDPITMQSDSLRIVAETAGVYVAIGTNPTATDQNFYVSSIDTETIAIGPPRSNRVVGVTTGSTTLIDFAEGTECPFIVGEAINLTVTGQSYYDFTHKIVTDVNRIASPNGYYSSRATVSHDSSGIVTAFNSPDAHARKSIKVAVKTQTGSGRVYIQQVQVS